jgi:hypothetical protein
VFTIQTKHEKKTLKRERQMQTGREQEKERTPKETKRESGEYFFTYYGFICDRDMCLECGV